MGPRLTDQKMIFLKLETPSSPRGSSSAHYSLNKSCTDPQWCIRHEELEQLHGSLFFPCQPCSLTSVPDISTEEITQVTWIEGQEERRAGLMKPRGSKLRHNLLHGRRMLCLLLEVDFFGIKTSSWYEKQTWFFLPGEKPLYPICIHKENCFLKVKHQEWFL